MQDVIALFQNAQTDKDYRIAKRRAGYLPIGEQFQVIDHIIAARIRLEKRGVL